AWSDSLGAYELTVDQPGARRIRFSRLGYQGLEMEVVLPPQGAMRLDAALRPRPVELSGVRLESGRAGRALPSVLAREVSRPEMGARTFAPDDRQLAPPMGEPDVMWALAGAPDVVLRPDVPTALHVRGGSADQNLVVLDGFPLLSPHHAGGALGAIPAEALADVTLHAGVQPASMGGALSSAIEVRTRDVPRQGLGASGGVGMRGVRGTFTHALPNGVGGMLVAGRRSYRPGFPGGDDDREGGFDELLGKATVDLPGGAIDVLSFASHDRLAFASATEPAGPAAAGGEAQAAPDPLLPESSNRFQWSSRTLGVAWRRSLGDDMRAEVRAWRSAFGATLDWAADGEPLRLRSSRSQLGAGARMSGPLAGGVATAGVSLERLGVRYDVESLAAANLLPPDETLLDLDSRAALLSAFVEEAWAPADRWSLRVGLRGQTAPGHGVLPEPRLSLSFAPRDYIRLSAGYARAHQSIQSLRNEESILDAVAGIDLPVIVGMPNVPLGRSDQLTVGLAATLGSGARFDVEAYTRRLDGLVLVAPTTSQPFALRGFERGSGRASGATVTLEQRWPRLEARAAYTLGNVVRESDGLDYHATFERSRSLSAAVNWRLMDRTTLTAGFLTSAGSPTTPVTGSFGWEPLDLMGEGEIEGSPQRTEGPLNGERLPAYRRLDLGLRQEWSPSWLRDGAALAARLDVLNVLDRENVVGYGLDPDTGVRRALTLLGRSLTFGLEWRY
ncbi:MAG: TonB-dependent receptor, partial [Gemmatimonadetes bacterium]|nr:TonB-dependent receptor [Gemmatimonadota bacterium]